MNTNDCPKCSKCGAPRPCTDHDEAAKPQTNYIPAGKLFDALRGAGAITKVPIEAVFEDDGDDDDFLNGSYNVRLYDTTGRLHDTQLAWFERNKNVETIVFKTNDRHCTYGWVAIGRIASTRFTAAPAGPGDLLTFEPGNLSIPIKVC